MASAGLTRMPWWAWTWQVLALIVIAIYITLRPQPLIAPAEGLALVGTVFAAVYHAEVVAHRVGEPFGSLVLAVAVTIIEVALIVSVMVGGGDTTAMARDTVFAAVMIVCNGIVGLCLLAGGLRHREQIFQLQGTQAALSVIVSLTVLTMVLPNVTSSTKGPTFSAPQLIFVAIVSLILYGSFLFVQTVRHRDYFLPKEDEAEVHALPPPNRVALASGALLFISLALVVAMAKMLTPTIENAIARAGAPKSVVGIVIAGLVLLPEGLAAFRAARANRLQTSMNLALGSVLATIGLTIPTIAGVSLLFHQPLTLGLSGKEELLLALTLIVSILTVGTGRTTMLQGIVHLVIFATFLFLAAVP